MKALAIAVAALLSASSAFAGNDQGAELRRPPPPGQSMPQPAPQPQHHSPRNGTLVVVDREELNARLARLERLLEEAEDRNGRGNGRGDNKLRRAQETLDSVQQLVSEAPLLGTVLPPPRPQPPPPPPPVVVRPMQEGPFKRLGEAVARESFAADKMRIIKMAANENHFLVSQVSQLLTHFPFSQDKLTVVRELKPRILDPENGYQLYGAFSFSGDKKKLEEILAQR